jgi:hypothetical protein
MIRVFRLTLREEYHRNENLAYAQLYPRCTKRRRAGDSAGKSDSPRPVVRAEDVEALNQVGNGLLFFRDSIGRFQEHVL